MSKKIVIDVNNNGSINAETFNISGVKCLDELDKLLNSLTLEVETTKKDDFFKEKAVISNNVTVKNK